MKTEIKIKIEVDEENVIFTFDNFPSELFEFLKTTSLVIQAEE